ncbi:hypothetical protein [Hyperthermus butylicus]|uniref:Conserved crenarchaeal protein n=1 Tax=Hyperthermus butylicus (strain DSM 5456 / JCM 9403 / PLM1-5) TaxID=415426 RepID=A2BL92_HYPBU|nr:hypothetical protein [Hyperthermus butylicus]ABM80753.1 conserved crenarchaeal protein [Hyperthermus butylicus DSM 5456]
MELHELDVRLRIAELEYLLRPVRVAITRDHGTVTIDGVHVELQKGIEVELPYWLSRAIEEEELGKLSETPMSLEDIARIHFTTLSTRTPADLEQLPQYFYQEAKEYIKLLDERVRRELNPALLEEKQKAQQYLLEIADKRLLIILQSLRSPTNIAELYSKLSPEEQTILQLLQKALERWRELVLPRPG